MLDGDDWDTARIQIYRVLGRSPDPDQELETLTLQLGVLGTSMKKLTLAYCMNIQLRS
jgi:hypothetical protein